MKKDSIQFKKKYGQNFLKDDSIPKKIVKSSSILDDSLVIEIGPGSGALTKELTKSAKQVLCYEIDQTLEEVLKVELLNCDNVTIIYDDFLKRDIKKDLEKYSYSHLYVIANLPYYITTPIITKLIEDKINVEKIVVMVQKEVADRFCSKPKTREYGSITVFLNYYFEIKKEFLVNRNCFIPKPNVDSCVISLIRKEKPLSLVNQNIFLSLVRDSFQFKRKNLRNNLKKYDLEKIEEILKKYNVDLTVRAEELSLEIFVDISNNLSI